MIDRHNDIGRYFHPDLELRVYEYRPGRGIQVTGPSVTAVLAADVPADETDRTGADRGDTRPLQAAMQDSDGRSTTSVGTATQRDNDYRHQGRDEEERQPRGDRHQAVTTADPSRRPYAPTVPWPEETLSEHESNGGTADGDATGLKIWWAQRHGGGGTPAAAQVTWYCAQRGTLAHFFALKALDDLAPADELVVGEEEYEAERDLRTVERWDGDRLGVLYSLYRDWALVQDWNEFRCFVPATAGIPSDIVLQEATADIKHGILPNWAHARAAMGIEEVLAREQMVFHTGYRYGGQFDLLYRTLADTTVLSDLKTSTLDLTSRPGVAKKYLMQGVAYADALPLTPDRIEVVRIPPAYGEWQRIDVQSSPWTREQLRAQFRAQCRGVHAAYEF